MHQTTVSVLTAVYNTDFVLVKRAIESILQQDFQDFEIIIIDDGSDNDSQNRLLDFVKAHEDKITYLRHSNRGQSLSINRGILNSTGRYITILDADDEYKPNHLKSCLAAIKYHDLIASVTETVVDSEDNYYVPDRKDHNRLIHVDECILFATLFGKRKVFESIQFQNEYGADANFYERAAQQFRVKKIDLKTYIYYRNNPTSICATIKRNHVPSES